MPFYDPILEGEKRISEIFDDVRQYYNTSSRMERHTTEGYYFIGGIHASILGATRYVGTYVKPKPFIFDEARKYLFDGEIGSFEFAKQVNEGGVKLFVRDTHFIGLKCVCYIKESDSIELLEYKPDIAIKEN